MYCVKFQLRRENNRHIQTNIYSLLDTKIKMYSELIERFNTLQE